MSIRKEKEKQSRIDSVQWETRYLLDDLQELILEENESYTNERRVTLCMARDYLREYFNKLGNMVIPLRMNTFPKSCSECIVSRIHNGKVRFCGVTGKNCGRDEEIPSWCPIVEIGG